jgi:predicted RNase H-like nuclease
MQLTADVRKQISVDITEFKGVKYKAFDDLLDGIFCAYLAYCFWYLGDKGCCVVGDAATGSVTLPKCPLEKCTLMQR